jgi:hypothetical protein
MYGIDKDDNDKKNPVIEIIYLGLFDIPVKYIAADLKLRYRITVTINKDIGRVQHKIFNLFNRW